MTHKITHLSLHRT